LPRMHLGGAKPYWFMSLSPDHLGKLLNRSGTVPSRITDYLVSPIVRLRRPKFYQVPQVPD
jgi:hypothetical protein